MTQKHQKELEAVQQRERSTRASAEQQEQERENQLQSKHAREVEMHRKTAEDLQNQLEANQQQIDAADANLVCLQWFYLHLFASYLAGAAHLLPAQRRIHVASWSRPSTRRTPAVEPTPF